MAERTSQAEDNRFAQTQTSSAPSERTPAKQADALHEMHWGVMRTVWLWLPFIVSFSGTSFAAPSLSGLSCALTWIISPFSPLDGYTAEVDPSLPHRPKARPPQYPHTYKGRKLKLNLIFISTECWRMAGSGVACGTWQIEMGYLTYVCNDICVLTLRSLSDVVT